MTLDLDNAVALDLESCLIRPGLCSPPVVVCGLWGPRYGAELHGTWELESPVRALLESDRLIIGHNVAYDFLCLFEHYPALRPLIVAAYEADRVLDTGLGQRIIEISTGDLRGRLALDRLCAAYGLVCEKTEERTDFGRFWGAPAAALPERHRTYALGDCEQTHRLFQRVWARELISRRDLAKFGRTDLWLKACSGYGLRTDPERVAALEAKAARCIGGLTELALELGYMRREGRKPDPVRTMVNIRIAVCEAYGLEYRREGNKIIPLDPSVAPPGLITDAGQISTSKLVLRESGSPQLEQLGDLGEWLAVWNKDLVLFRQGTELPFHTRFGFANTTRTTSSSPNCFDGATEVLTRGGWCRFDALADGVEIAQWHDGQIDFVLPEVVIRRPHRGDLVRVHTQEQIDLLMTPDHRCLLQHRKTGALRVFRADEYPSDWKQLHGGEHRGGRISLPPALLTMVLAYQADGSDHAAGGIRFGFTKARKIERLRAALAELGWQHTEPTPGNFYLGVNNPAVADLRQLAPEKKLAPWLLDLDWAGLCHVCDEIWQWDGCATQQNHYASCHRSNADLVQALLALRGWRARQRVYLGSVSPSYQVDVVRRDYSLTTNRQIDRVPWDGMVYCATVPSGFLLIRRGQNVAVTGNCQNFRKKAGIRECIVPRGGAFVDTDFTGVELSALAQICVNLHGDRRMADRINSGVDMHAEVGAELLRLPYDEVVRRRKAFKNGDHSDEARQANFSRDCGKYGNFGCMGYMTNPATFASYVRLGSISAETGLPMINLSVPEAQRVIDAWYSSQHAQVRYLRSYVDGLRQGSHRGALYAVPIPGTDIVRRGATRTAAANTPFQGLAMQVAAEAGWGLFVQQLLHGRPGRVCVFAHDAFLSDCRPDQADEVAALHESAMLNAAAKLMPDIRQKTESVAMSHWAKDAERVVRDGKLQVYEVK